jgi:diguanylate cyclase (GGDEF)-like protein/PAS domain S-box-containing protein
MDGHVESERAVPTRVLLVEDNPGDAHLVRSLLAEDGPLYRVLHVSSLDAAAAARRTGIFDVVLTDLGLPDSDGSGTVDGMLRLFPDTPVVVLTGLDDSEIGAMAVQMGCQDYLVKGFDDPQLLRRTIRHAMERNAVACALKESEARFRTLVEVSPEAILLCTADKVLFANAAAARLFAAPQRQALQEQHPCRFVGGAICGRLVGGTPSADSDRVASDECALTRFDGTVFDAEVIMARVTHGNVPAVEIIVRDVSLRNLAERQRRLSAAVFEASDEAMLVTDADNRILAVNGAFERVTGYRADEVRGLDPHVLSSGRHDRGFYADMWCHLLGDGHWRGDVWNRRKNGELYVQRATFSLIRGSDGRVVNHVGVFSDVTDEKQEAERIRHSANYDALTGLPNRTLLRDRMQQALSRAARERGRVGVLFLDLDGFKPVNDRHGHLVGDHLLVAVAERLLGCVRESDTVARLGGDEFVIVLPDLAESADAQAAAEQVIRSLEAPFTLDGCVARVGASIGVALSPDNGATADELLAAADAAMYAAKRAGKGRAFVAARPPAAAVA